MLGAILGDIAGSSYEFGGNRTKPKKLWTAEDYATDDTVLTCAGAFTLAHCESLISDHMSDADKEAIRTVYVYSMKLAQGAAPNVSWGTRFVRWLGQYTPVAGLSFAEWKKANPVVTNSQSKGNGAAMKISPVAYAAANEQQVKDLSDLLTSVTHDTPEGKKAAEATAMLIYKALKGADKSKLKELAESYYPGIADMTVGTLRKSYEYTELAEDTVPQAIVCFLEADSFREAVANAVSIGGDADTLAAISGAIAEAFYKYARAQRAETEGLYYPNSVYSTYYAINEDAKVEGSGYIQPLLKMVSYFDTTYGFMKRLQKDADKA